MLNCGVGTEIRPSLDIRRARANLQKSSETTHTNQGRSSARRTAFSVRPTRGFMLQTCHCLRAKKLTVDSEPQKRLRILHSSSRHAILSREMHMATEPYHWTH